MAEKMDDRALAIGFADRHARDLRYLHKRREWQILTGARWEPDRTLMVRWLVCVFLREMAARHGDEKRLGSVWTIKAVERMARDLLRLQ
jgi:putative DNA primase/helicase